MAKNAVYVHALSGLSTCIAVLLGVKPHGDVHAMNHADRRNRIAQEFIGVENICLCRGEQIDGKPN